MAKVLSDLERTLMDAYWRAANYLSVGQIYLYDNPLKEPLQGAHQAAAPWSLGHDARPQLHLRAPEPANQKAGPRHDLYHRTGAWGHRGWSPTPTSKALTAKSIPQVSPDEEGMKRLFTQFSFPGGIPSHVAPETPGSIHEGGELGYALSHAYGAAFDNPDLIVACVVGDGEAETGPLATSWHSNKFLNPVNGRRGSADPASQRIQDRQSLTVLARISHEELKALFRGYGYTPYFVEGDEPEEDASAHGRALDQHNRARSSVHQGRREAERLHGAPSLAHDRAPHTQRLDRPKTVEGNQDGGILAIAPSAHRGHETSPAHLRLLEEWMQSYRPAGVV